MVRSKKAGLGPMTEKKNQSTGGTGFQPVQSFHITRRNLPHFQEPGRVYFITWRCKEGRLLSPEERQVTMEALRHWDGIKWTLYAAVGLPDHLHALTQPLPVGKGGVIDLGEIIKSVKGFSAWKINRLRKSEGSIWQDERHDRIVRDEGEFLEKWQYIKNNPLKAGLASNPEDYPWLYEKIR
jgi:putative transposase